MAALDIDKICRVCLQTDSCLSPLFVDQASPLDEVSFPDMISECTNYNVCRDDVFPQLICERCKERTRNAYYFKKLYETSQRTLTAFLTSVAYPTESDFKPNISIIKSVQMKTEKAATVEEPSDALLKSDLKKIVKTEVFEIEDIPETENSSANMEAKDGAAPSNFLEQDELIIKNEHGSEMESETEESNMSFRVENDDEVPSGSQDCSESSNVSKGDQTIPATSDRYDNASANRKKIDKKPSRRPLKDKSRPHKCDKCDKSYTQKCLLREHQITHSELKPYQCQLCQKAFKRAAYLTVHVANHTGEFRCTICDRNFGRSYLLRAHNSEVHEKPKIFKCDKCDKTFKRSVNLRYHALRHESSKPFPCADCEKSFYTKHELTVHLLTHTGDRPYKCQVCDKSFGRVSYLNIHVRTHAKERPFNCATCGKGFVRKKDFRTHLYTHAAKPFQCDECDKAFASSDKLEEHKRIHHNCDGS